jgi:hypothetical protein
MAETGMTAKDLLDVLGELDAALRNDEKRASAQLRSISAVRAARQRASVLHDLEERVAAAEERRSSTRSTRRHSSVTRAMPSRVRSGRFAG